MWSLFSFVFFNLNNFSFFLKVSDKLFETFFESLLNTRFVFAQTSSTQTGEEGGWQDSHKVRVPRPPETEECNEGGEVEAGGY